MSHLVPDQVSLGPALLLAVFAEVALPLVDDPLMGAELGILFEELSAGFARDIVIQALVEILDVLLQPDVCAVLLAALVAVEKKGAVLVIKLPARMSGIDESMI